MSRMLTALKQIESKGPGIGLAAGPDPATGDVRQLGPGPGTPAIEGPVEQVPGVPQAHRDLAKNVLSQLRAGRPAALMFTSPGDGEGRSGALVPLAAALVEQITGEVVAVDANFRSADLARHFGVTADRGLSDVLLSDVAWPEVVRPAGRERLSVLPWGKSPAADGRLLRGPGFAKVLEDLRHSYRLVLIESASLAHRSVAATSGICDGTYLVIRLGQTRRGAVRQAVRVVEGCGGRLLGCVVTGVPERE